MRIKCLSFVVLLAAFTRIAAADVSRAPLLPEDAALRVRFSNLGAFFDAMEPSSISRLWKDDQMQAFMNRPDPRKWVKENLLSFLPGEAAEIVMEQWKLFRNGEWIFGLAPGEYQPYMLVESTPEQYARSLDLDQQLSRIMGPDRLTTREEIFQGVTLRGIEIKLGEETTSSWEAFAGNTVIVGPNREWVEKTIMALLGKTPAPIEGAPSLTLKADTRKWMDLLIQKLDQEFRQPDFAEKEGMPVPPKPSAVFAAMGVTQIREIVVAATAEADHLRMDVHTTLTTPPTGLLAMIDPRPVPVDLRVPFVPAHALSYAVSRINLQGLWKEIPNIARQISPEMGGQIEQQIAAIPIMLGVDLEQDVFALLDSLILSYSFAADEEYQEVMALRVRDTDSLQRSLDRMLDPEGMLGAATSQILKRETFRDHTLYEFTLPGAADQPNSFGIAAGSLLFGHNAALRAAITAADSAAADTVSGFYATDRYKRLRAMLPERCIAYGVYDVSGIIRQMLRMLSPNLPELLENAGKSDAPSPFSRWDLSRMPPAGHIASFFGPSYSFATWDGQKIRTRTLMYYQGE